ncbi:MAG: NHL repeat-containing protein [Candidatus Kryptonium sp.]
MRLLSLLFFSFYISLSQSQIKTEFLFKFGNLNNPHGISVSPAGEIYIADTGNNSVKKFSKNGQLICEVTGYGWGVLEFDQPYDVDAGGGISIYVADYNNHRVQRFDKNLNYVATLQGGSDEKDFFGFPRSVAFSKFGDLFIIDEENLRCVKINKFNKVEKTFGGIEAGQGRLVNPIQIAIVNQNLIVVVDGNYILIYDYYGNFLREFGSEHLKNPTGLFADSLIYVADGNDVFMFSPEGKFLGKISIDERVYDIARQDPFLYCLTDKEVLVYKLTFPKNEEN